MNSFVNVLFLLCFIRMAQAAIEDFIINDEKDLKALAGNIAEYAEEEDDGYYVEEHSCGNPWAAGSESSDQEGFIEREISSDAIREKIMSLVNDPDFLEYLQADPRLSDYVDDGQNTCYPPSIAGDFY